MLKQVALDERIDKSIRDEYLADLSEQIGFDIVINDKPTDFKLDKNTHDNIMQKFTKVMQGEYERFITQNRSKNGLDYKSEYLI